MRFIELLLLATCACATAIPLEDAVWFENRKPQSWPCAVEEGRPDWKPFDLPVRTARTVSLREGEPVVLSTRFEHPQTASQGLVLVGGNQAELACNGKPLEPIRADTREPLYALPLVKGKNTLSIRFQQPQSGHAQIHLSPVELDYVLPPQRDSFRRFGAPSII